jgi:hypothetical protein
MDEPKTLIAFLGHLQIIQHLNEKAKAIADCLQIRFTCYDLSGKNHERRVETGVQALLASVDDTPMGNFRHCDIHQL